MPSSLPNVEGKAPRSSPVEPVSRDGSPGRYAIRTFGCQMNLHDSERIAGMLEAAGMERAAGEADADLIVFNTCCVRENADNRLYGNLGALKAARAAKPGLRIAVGGCLAQKDGGGIVDRAPHVDVVFGTHNISKVPELLRRRDATGLPAIEIAEAGSDDAVLASTLPAGRERPYSAWVTISVGCDNSCTFCIVPAVRGPEVSRRPGEVIAEVERLAAGGTVEVTLLGQNVNSYGRDLGLDGHKPIFARLLRQVDAVEGIRRIRFTSPHPKDLGPETIEAMADCDALMPQLHLPLQSGSRRILSAMHRGYDAERFLDRVAQARSAIDDLALTTDIIVGFPGETDTEFEATLEVVREARFDSAFTFVYSPRPGTRAATMDGQVDPIVAGERCSQLSALVNEISLEANRARIGRREELLVEGASKKDAARLTGRTPHNRPAHFENPGSVAPGDFVVARITGAAPHHLLATVEAPQKSRPVSIRLG